jgi:acyl transferase domain-containing protein/acyl carrier protein
VNEPLAIVGMACRLPGADGLDAFWNLVVEGRTAWGRLPESRLPRDLYFHPEKSRLGKSYSELGAVVSDRPVDPAVCPITPAMLERFDVAHAIFLEVASLACRDAGQDPFAMPADRRTGVYVGHTGGSTRIGDIVYATGIDETARYLTDLDVARELLGPETAAVADELTAAVRRRYGGREPGCKLDLGALAAAKLVQQALKLDGPYLVVDAACASSLQAMAIGARAVLEGSIDQAIVGGASYCKSDSLVLFSAAQSVSNAGSCPFGQDADGLVTAEGYVALVIKKLSRAIADGDRIRAVIRGLGVASDGKGKSLWAPRQEGQVLAVERAYPDAAAIARIEYIEAHATSTQVGDATELGALSRLMGRHLPAGRQIPIGSVKANIGHTLETAGIASLVKVVLAMEHGMIPPGTTAKELNEEFDWAGGPFNVPAEPLAWPAHADGSPRCAAVNAFGIGGLNVHVSLAEHVPATMPTTPAPRPDHPAAEAIAIVGAGCVLPGALTLESFFELLDRADTAIGPVPADRWDARRALDRSGPRAWHTTADVGGFVRDFVYDWRRHKVPPKQIAAANPLQFMLLEAADAAIKDAGGTESLDRKRTGVVVGTLFGGDFANQLQMGLRLPETRTYLEAALRRRGLAATDIERIMEAYEERLLEKLPALVDETGSFTSSTLASRLTKTFDLMGGALALDAGDCSSLAALSAAVDMLRQGTCDTVLCAAGERCMDLMAFEGRSLGGFLADRPVSVLDGRTAGGDVPGEGAVVFVLKRLADARAAGNTIHGVIRGVCVTAGQSRDEAIETVVREAGEAAGIAPVAVTTVELAVAGGHRESGRELSLLAERYTVGSRPVTGGLDGLVGHLGAAAGAAGLLKLTRALATGSMPGTAALASGHAGAVGLAAAVGSLPIPACDAAGFRAGSVTVVQEGQAGHLVVDNGMPVPAAARVAADPAATATGRGPRPLPASVTPVAGGRPLVAAIFPGQGSQYTDMFRGVVAEVPAAAEVLRRLDAEARAAGCETLAEIAWRPDNGLGTRIWDTQWSMYLGDLLAWGVLESFGFAPDHVASHSFGEFPALTAIGAWSMADGITATRARAEAVERHGPRNGAMLSVIADAATVAAAIEPFAGQAWVCAANAPEQHVVGGTARIVDAIEVLLESRRVKTKRLAVPSPFHTPLLQAAADELATTLRSLPIQAPSKAILSSTTLRQLDQPADVLESLVRQMTETVRWIEVVNRLYDAGVRTFVEVGPSGVLSGLTRRVLEGRPGTTFLQFDQRGRSPREHLERLRDQLAAAGCLREAQPAVVARPAAAPTSAGSVVSFDATARRRARNRQVAGGQQPAAPGSRAATAASAAPGNGNGHDHREINGNGHGNGHLTPAKPTRSEPAPVRPASLGVNRLVTAVSPPEPVAVDDRCLEDIVGELVSESGLGLPLGGDVEISRTGRSLLDSLQQLFSLTPADRPAVLAAASLESLCDVLARSGGKAEWLPRRPRAKDQPTDVRSAGDATGTAATEVEKFLVEFVVEQTGYPAEIVDLDADLEADLGIDSIRKAQLFGEVGQRYGLKAEDGVSLDDFPTLRSLVAYLLPRVGGESRGAAVGGKVATVVTNGQANSHPGQANGSSNGQTNGQANGHATSRANGQANGQHDANRVTLPSAGGPASFDGAAAAVELERFLVEFVVEQTGYPAEIVELDADLEADLGIDSIRKAQLFGEVGQRYGLQAEDGVSLDDFPTLRHLIAYLVPRVAGGTASGSSSSAPRNASSANPSPPAPAATRSSVAAVSVPARAPARAALAEELERFLVEFVVEQTGYPAEIVELDADLEADLGIDSIRKAQLFGEVGQRYGLQAEDGVSLDDFPTLRSLIDYLVARIGGSDQPPSDGSPTDGDAGPPVRLPATGRAVAVRGWARQVAAAVPVSSAATIEPMLAEELAALAFEVGVDEAIMHAAAAAPAAAVGGCDVVLVTPRAVTEGAAGFLACFGRHADLDVNSFERDGVAGTLVSATGLPGAILGWNDAGLMAFIALGAATDVPPSGVVERIVTGCRTLAAAERLLASLARAPRGLVVAAAEGSLQVEATGAAEPAGASIRRAERSGPLVRVALADGDATADAAIARLIGRERAACDTLSAACPWLAVGGGATDAVTSGGPWGRDWAGLCDGLGSTWVAKPAAKAGVPAAAPHQAGSATDHAAVTRRYELALVDLGAVTATRSLAGERVAVLGTGPLAAALERQLAAAGAVPVSIEAAAVCDPEAAAFTLARAEAAGALRHLVVVAARGQTAGEAISAAFVACQKWLAARVRAGDVAASTLTAVCELGGGFGLADAIGEPTSGGLAGLFKGLAREFPDLQVRVVDTSATLPAADSATAVIAELTAGSGPVEVGSVDGRRVTVQAVERPAAPAVENLPALARGTCWVVTGGARGVTAACARELGRRHGVSLVLVGSTKPVAVEPGWLDLAEDGLRELKSRLMLAAKRRGDDPRQAWSAVEKSIEISRSLKALAAEGIVASYEACDLADAVAVRSLMARVARDVGPIRGIVHGAGWESACRFEKKTPESLARTVGPKCAGLEHLLAAADAGSLEMLVAFGSTSGRLGGHGQADYSLANEMLAKLVAAARQRRPGLRATTFHWHAWDEVGMASRPESRFVLEQFGLKFMPLAEGVGRFMAEVEAGLPVAEVLVTERAMLAHADALVPEPAAGKAASPARASTAVALPANAGSLVERISRGDDVTSVSFRLDPLSDRFLVDHLHYGRPLLPAVMGAELIAQAVIASGSAEIVGEIRDFAIERPCVFPTDAARELRVEVSAGGEARGLAANLGSDGQPTGTERVHFRGVAVGGPAAAFKAEVGEPTFPFNPMVYQESAPLRHGPSFRTLEGLFLDRNGGWARLTAPRGMGVAAPRGERGWTIPAALLDGVIVGCAVFSYILCGRRVEIPVKFERLRIAARPAPGEACTARMHFRTQNPRETVYDILVAGADGRPLLALDGLHLAVTAGERSPPG